MFIGCVNIFYEAISVARLNEHIHFTQRVPINQCNNVSHLIAVALVIKKFTYYFCFHGLFLLKNDKFDIYYLKKKKKK